MDPLVTFDPHKLTPDEKQFLINKIDTNSEVDINNNCKLWTKIAKKNGYPQMKLGTTIAAKFGNPDRPFNPASIYYSITHNFVLLKTTNIRLSHRCHNKFCVNMNHIIMETMATNIQRNGCRDNQQCTGHGTAPMCIF